MFRKFIFILIPLLIITLVFLGLVLVINRQGGKGALQVTSKPKAQVFLDNEYVGDTPLSLSELSELLEIGEYKLRIVPTEKGFREWEQNIPIYKGALTVVDRTFEKSYQASSGSIITLTDISEKEKSELMIVSFPTGAQVILDSNDKGKTPILIDDITASDHEIKILKDGYREKVVKIKTIPGKRLEVEVSLGIRTDLTEQKEASGSASLKRQVVILDTPTGFLRVRDDSSLNSSQIDTVNPGDIYDLITELDDWFQILLSDEKTGWVSSEYAEISEVEGELDSTDQ